MSDPRYDYPIVAASKVIIKKGNSVLFTKEPLENEWMPGRFSLPGGKYFLNEGILDGTKRKIDNEAGVACQIKGLYKVIQILMPEKTVYHFVFVADYLSGELDKASYSDELVWKTKEEALAFGKDDLTEYYYSDLLAEYFQDPDRIVPLDFIRELQSFKDPEIQAWMRKGNKERA